VTGLQISDCLGGHIELDNCHQVDIRDCSSTIHIVGDTASTGVIIHHCTLRPTARVGDELAALFALRSVRNAIVESCVLDVSEKDRPAILLGGKGTGAVDVLIRGNLLTGGAGATPLLLIDDEGSAERAVIADNGFRFDKREGVAVAILAHRGQDVVIRENRFDAPGAKVAQAITIGNPQDKPLPGPWEIHGNIDRTEAPAGGWKIHATDVALVSNTMPFAAIGEWAREEGNVIGPPAKVPAVAPKKPSEKKAQ
jgi:hypothetical protein